MKTFIEWKSHECSVFSASYKYFLEIAICIWVRNQSCQMHWQWKKTSFTSILASVGTRPSLPIKKNHTSFEMETQTLYTTYTCNPQYIQLKSVLVQKYWALTTVASHLNLLGLAVFWVAKLFHNCSRYFIFMQNHCLTGISEWAPNAVGKH